jgi:hypothetical protein
MSMAREQILQQHASASVIQERFDSAFEPWGVRARAPTLGEDVNSYWRDLAVQGKRLLSEDHELRKPQYRSMPDDAFKIFEPQLRRAVYETALRPDTVPVGQLRRVEQVDQNGLKIVSWIGQESFVRDMGRPGRRVISFRTDQGFFDASGRPMR